MPHLDSFWWKKRLLNLATDRERSGEKMCREMGAQSKMLTQSGFNYKIALSLSHTYAFSCSLEASYLFYLKLLDYISPLKQQRLLCIGKQQRRKGTRNGVIQLISYLINITHDSNHQSVAHYKVVSSKVTSVNKQ